MQVYEHPNQQLLDEVNASKSWFRAKKVRPIWAKRVDKPTRVRTIEGDEDVPAGAYLCRGEAGDIWPQAADSLNAKYVATKEYDSDGWRMYTPHPDHDGVMAARIDRAFTVQASWGELNGKQGDYVVKNYGDRDAAYPDDVWIVDAVLFEATYEAVGSASR